MTNRNVGLLQLFSLTFFLSHFFFLFYGGNIIKISGSDTIFSCLLGTFLNIFLFSILLRIRKHKKTKSKNKVLAIAIALIILVTIFLVANDTTYFVIHHYLENGNYFYIFLLLLICAYIISKRNMDSVASLALLLFFLFVPSFIYNMIGSINILDLSYLKPPFNSSFANVIKGALLFSFYTLLPLLLLLFIPYDQVDQKEKQHKYLHLGLIISNIVTIISFMMIGLGPSFVLASTYQYPYMVVINKISGFLVFNRLSYIFSLYLLFDATVLLGLLFSILKKEGENWRLFKKSQ